MVHRLELVDRGVGKRRRWLTACSCGEWTGKPWRRKPQAVSEYHTHVDQVAHRKEHVKPRPVTAAADLPVELQPNGDRLV